MNMFDKAVLGLPGARRMLAWLLASALVKAGLVVGQALALTTAIVNLWNAGNVTDQLGWVALFFVCFLGRQLVKTLRDRALDAFASERASELRDDLLRTTFSVGPRLVQEQGTGNVTTTLVEGVDQVENYLSLILPKLADLLVVPLGLLVALFVLDWVTGLIALAIFPCIILFMVILGSLAHDEAARQRNEYQRLSNHFVDSLRGIDTLKLFGRAREHGAQIYDVSEKFRAATIKTLRVATLSSAVLDLFTTLGLAGICIMMGFRVVDGSLAFWPALAALILSPEYFRPIREFASDFHASLDGKNALASILALTAQAGETPHMGQQAPEGIGMWDGDSELELRSVSFTYPELTGPLEQGSPEKERAEDVEFVYDDDPRAAEVETQASQLAALREVPPARASNQTCEVPQPALEDVSLRVSGLVKVGIVGMSGSGKSTLISLLGGFAEPTSGMIAVNGADYASLHRADWQRQVTFIPQNPYVFHATLRDNVAFYRPDATEAQIRRAVEVAGLSDVVKELPQGLDTLVGEGARALSGGQAQRIALARAFLDDDRRILLFDEPTAHLDIETEMELKERMLPLMEGRLVFFATHRLHWMTDMDVIAVLERGRLAQVGTPDELIGATSGAFARLAAQLRGGEER